jgi:hypothetical protein
MAGEEGGLTKIFGVTLHDIDELGVGQDYQLLLHERPGRHPADRTSRKSSSAWTCRTATAS